MRSIAQQIRQEARLEGIQEGLQQGLEKAVQQGLEQGVQREKLAAAKMMLAEGATMSFIQKITGLNQQTIAGLAMS